MADAIKTMGMTMKKGTGAGTAVINLTDISRSGTSGGAMDTTNLSSTNGIKTYLTAGVFEQGEISISFNYDPSDTSHKLLVTDWQIGGTTNTPDKYTFTFSNADTFVADLIPVSFDWGNALGDDGKLEATVTLKMSGANITDPS